jgi:hypothetical protein
MFSIPQCSKKKTDEKVNYLNLEYFKNKKVSDLLSSLKEQYTEYYFIDEPPGKLRGCKFYYPENNIILTVYVSEYEFVNRVDSTRNWSIELFKKEKVSTFEIMDDKK